MKMSILAVEGQSEWTIFKRACFLVPDLMDTWFVCTKVEKQNKLLKEKKREGTKEVFEKPKRQMSFKFYSCFIWDI